MKQRNYRTYKSEVRAMQRAEYLERLYPGKLFHVMVDPNGWTASFRWIVTIKLPGRYVPCA